MVTALAALLMLGSPVSPASALDEADRLFLVGEQALADRFYPVAKLHARAVRRPVSEGSAHAPRHAAAGQSPPRALNEPQPALEAFRRAQTFLSSPAELLEAKFWEAEALFRLKRFGEGADGVRRGRAGRRRLAAGPEALYGYGFCELELKRPEPAITAFRDFTNAWPDTRAGSGGDAAAGARVRRAQALQRRAVAADDVRHEVSELEARPRCPVPAGLGPRHEWRSRGGMADLRAFLAANPNHEQAPRRAALMGEALGKYGDREDLVESYKALMAQDPPTAECALRRRGRSRAVSGSRRIRKKPGSGCAPSFPITQLTPAGGARARQRRVQSEELEGRRDARSGGHPEATTDKVGRRPCCSSARRIEAATLPAGGQGLRGRWAVSPTSTPACGSARWPAWAWREEQKEWKAALTALRSRRIALSGFGSARLGDAIARRP